MKKIIQLLLMGAIILVSHACGEDFFEQARRQSNTGDGNWATTEELEALVVGAYYGKSGYAGFRGINGFEFIHEALHSDLGYLHPFAGDYETEAYNRTAYTRNDLSNYQHTWAGGYYMLALANDAISFIEANGAFNDDLGPVWTDRILGEALFIRAYAHFILARIFAPPYGSNNQAPSIILADRKLEPFEFPARAPLTEVYDLIISDLSRAIELLPEEYNPALHPESYIDRAKRDAARFLLARVYFQMGPDMHPLAKEQCDIILSSGRYPLSERPLEAWNKFGLGEKGSEVVWQYVQYNGQQSWKASPIGFIPLSVGERVLSASETFLNAVGWNPENFSITNVPGPDASDAQRRSSANFQIESEDLRLADLWRAIPGGTDPNQNFTQEARTLVWCNKFFRNNSGTGNGNQASIPHFRSAELYLIRAIINFRAGNAEAAVADVNVVRARAGLAPLPVGPETADEAFIHHERMKEMAFEEDRLYYLQALRLPIPAGDRAESALPWDSPRFVMQIPASETDLNPNVSN
jgi:starch-binding outer membrane protein, SusD/RagB family